MRAIEKLLTAAYQDITSDEVDIDFVAGCLAEALAHLQGDAASFAEPPKVVKLDNIDAMSDELYDALDDAFKEELERQGHSGQASWQHWTIQAEYEEL